MYSWPYVYIYIYTSRPLCICGWTVYVEMNLPEWWQEGDPGTCNEKQWPSCLWALPLARRWRGYIPADKPYLLPWFAICYHWFPSCHRVGHQWCVLPAEHEEWPVTGVEITGVVHHRGTQSPYTTLSRVGLDRLCKLISCKTASR